VPGGTDNIIKKLEEEKKKEGSLPQLLEFYQKLLRIESRLGSHIDLPKPSLTSKTINYRIAHGLPLVKFDELALDWSLLPDTFVEVADLFAQYAELFGLKPEELKELKPGRLLTRETVKAWFEGTPLSPQIKDSGVNEVLLEHIIQATLRPFLIKHCQALISLVDQERWRRGYCPVCGGNPDFAFLDEERGARWLLCSRCDAEWLFQRLECPGCGTQDQNDLAYFTDDKGLYRLYVCERCKRYLKAIDRREAKSEVLLPLERWYTVDMDRQARERGYSPYGTVTRTEERNSTTK